MLKKIIVLLACALPFVAVAEETPAFRNESELGMVLTGGNTDITTITVKQSNAINSGLNTYKFTANYLQSSDAGFEKALSWGLGLRYERALSDRWSLFAGQLVESNKFQNIQQRYATDIGGKYIFRDEENFKWHGEGGYRFARENYTTATYQNIHFARLYSEAQYVLSTKSNAKLWVEWLPNLVRWKGYQLNTELSLTALLSDLFSIKTAYLLKLNNEPPAGTVSKTDSTFTTSLMAKF